MSATYHIFYDSNKEIMWSATAGVDSAIITGQKSNNNYDYVSLTLSETPIGEKFSRALAHVIKTQMPGSIEQFKRLEDTKTNPIVKDFFEEAKRFWKN